MSFLFNLSIQLKLYNTLNTDYLKNMRFIVYITMYIISGCLLTAFFSPVLNEEQVQELQELVDPTAKFFEVCIYIIIPLSLFLLYH